MKPEDLHACLESSSAARDWMCSLGLENLERGHTNLVAIADAGVPLDLLSLVCAQLEKHVPALPDPDMAMNNFERFVTASRSPLGLCSLLDRDPEALPILLQIFSTSQYMSDLLIRDPESFDLLRLTDGQPVARDVLVEEICSEVNLLKDDRLIMAALRRFKHRETLRIAYGDIIRKQTVEVVTRQISYLADSLCEAALTAARRKLEEKRGVPRGPDGQPAQVVVLGMGKLGGTELNYSSDIDLIFISDTDGQTDGTSSVSNQEFFQRLVRDFVRLLTESTDLGSVYRVDLRLRPDGDQGPSVITAANARRYYDVKGRTWERQAFVKARPIAGDLELGRKFLSQLEPWIYRRYLNRADITGIRALKRRIEHRAQREGTDDRNVKTGHGGIRDIEFVIQFLQLLNGAELPEVRTGNTLEAISRLEQTGCLTWQERSILEENYDFLRKIEHRLQIMFDLRTHTLPEDEGERRRLALRMGFSPTEGQSALEAFQHELTSRTNLNRKILDHLLHDAFGDETETSPETDLVLDPRPSEATIDEVLGRYQFRSTSEAYRNLMALSTERISFLSTRRCRHFLASIAPQLLAAISRTPDPDATLVNLSKVSDSLGGKVVLWELFSFNPPSLELYVRLCASSPYLSGLLTSNPGMIDELMDSLVLNKLPSLKTLSATLTDLCRGAEDVDPILHSFKNSQHLRVGVRDILGKDDIRDTHRALSDIAETCLQQITRLQFERLASRLGEPTLGDAGEVPCSFIIVAMGKLGGSEPNYHSDLDVVFLYEGAGLTRHRVPTKRDNTSNQHFFSQLAQRVIKVVTQLGPFGRLYELDPRLRPSGKSGALVVSLDEFRKYFESGQGQLWERQALCKARPVYGTEAARVKSMEIIRQCIIEPPWQDKNAEQIRQMRIRLEETASARNLKRGPGGTVDVEFLVQMLQLKNAAEHPGVLKPGTLDAIVALQEAGCLDQSDAEPLGRSYRLLRSIESGLRLMNTTARHDLPEDEFELTKLAYLLGYASGDDLLQKCLECTRDNRARFERLFQAVGAV